MELLSPAGNYKAFIGALNAGCDAVYLGGTKFGARAYADNFSDEEIIKAIKVAHLHNVKVYLTVNTLIKEKEFKEVISYINTFYEAGLDACIVQDLGLISVFNKYFPKMECHISTQGFSIGLESVEFYKKMGATRVVLARELTLDEITYIKKNCDIELETFIHGAMCYCYSGECLFSSALGGRSGNRGRCAGPCRLPYSINGKENYLLSMKDQCTIEILPKLIDAGIDSLKIEGRMKKPEYTAFVTAIYRKYIDLYKENPKNYKVDKKDLNALRHIYLRSQIGEGYYFKRNGQDMLTLSSPSYSGNDEELMKEINSRFLEKEIKLPVTSFAYVHEGCNLSITFYYKDFYATKTGPLVEKASNKPTSKEDISKQICKTGDSSFYVSECNVDTDDLSFVPIKVLNECRRDCLDELMIQIDSSYCDSMKVLPKRIPFERHINEFEVNDLPFVSVMDIFQYRCVKQFDEGINIVITSDLLKEKIEFNDKIVVKLPDIIRKDSMDYLKLIYDNIVLKGIKTVIVSNFEELNYLCKKGYSGKIIAGPELYSFNKCAKETLLECADNIIIPYELSRHEIKDLEADKALLFVYGKLPLMHSANCVKKTTEGCSKNNGDKFLYIKDRTNVKLPVYRDCNVCSNTIFNSVPTCIFDEEDFVSNFTPYLSFTDESFKETKEVLESFFGKRKITGSFTKAYFKRGIE